MVPANWCSLPTGLGVARITNPLYSSSAAALVGPDSVPPLPPPPKSLLRNDMVFSARQKPDAGLGARPEIVHPAGLIVAPSCDETGAPHRSAAQPRQPRLSPGAFPAKVDTPFAVRNVNIQRLETHDPISWEREMLSTGTKPADQPQVAGVGSPETSPNR